MVHRMTTLLSRLEEAGFQARAVPIAHLEDLRREIEGWREKGLIGEEFWRGWLIGFRFAAPDTLPAARSIVIAANPQPQVRVTFHWGGRARQAMVPPTYNGRVPDRKVQEALAAEGCAAVRAALPLKLLAVRCGLGRYGRNNVCYVPGLGSFHRPVAFFTELPVEEDPWREPAMLARCRDCTACLRHCPTGAITAERFLIHGERCLTSHNERPAAFANWIDPSWHHCLIGCFRCQQVCPENKDHLGWIEAGPEFLEEETALILQGASADQLPAGARAKLEALDLLGTLEVLPRNLAALLQLGEERDG